ncbi:hypothetical protein M413DRAFT_442139 [Hebeloma cylindrosporum]|uniref:Microbial-type PARG catalytic domain-containing protein n=1 Tax=Hebeloma cylindrosporum TaxID=76867 RepID=A0A0C3CNR9_HEBCY|nr:hypothetical protein M413DRAFT_442139 [Hebeloma cylindrosporum h7]
MPPVPNVPPSVEYHVYRTSPYWHNNPQYVFWQPPGCVPGPLPIHLPQFAPPREPPPNRLRRHRPNQQQRPSPYPPPQPQMTHVPAQTHHSHPQSRPRSPSRSRPAQRQPSQPAPDTRSRSRNPRPATTQDRTRSHSPQSRNPQPATPTRTRSRSRSPYPRREDDGRRAILKGFANETIAALNNGAVDVSTTQQHTELFLESSQELADWRRPRAHQPSAIRTKIEVLPLSTLKGARHLHDLDPRSKIGVLNFASATSPGGGFLNGARAQEESIARSSSLYVSLTTDAARPFYALHAGRGENNGFYTHAMIYSPEVHLFRDDDGTWLNAIPVDIVTSPAVNAGKVRRRYTQGDALENKIEAAMRERMARVLALFEMKGATSLVLGSFGTGVFQNDVGVVARVWRDLLINRDARFRSAFREVVFCIPDAHTRGVFEAALFSRGGGRGPYVPAHAGDGGGDP